MLCCALSLLTRLAAGRVGSDAALRSRQVPAGSCSSARFQLQLWAGAGPPVRAQSHSTAPLQTSLASSGPHVLLIDCLKTGVPLTLLGCCEFAGTAPRAPRNITSFAYRVSLGTEGRKTCAGGVWGARSPPALRVLRCPSTATAHQPGRSPNPFLGVSGRSHPRAGRIVTERW